MSKYIDADRLRAEIEERKKVEGWCEVGKDTADVYYARGFRFACDFALTVIDSLQQDETQVDKMLCSQAWWEEQGWIMIQPDATIEGIDSLLKQVRKKLQQKQPDLPGIEEPGIPGKDYIPVEWVDACEMYGKWKIVKQEHPDVDLEKALDEYYKNADFGPSEAIEYEIHKDIARHFYELGVLNARREVSK